MPANLCPIRREIEDYLAAVKDRLEYRTEVLETVAIDLNKPVTGLTGYDGWRADIDRLAETGRRIMDDHDTYASHLNGIPLGLEHMRWALTDIGRLIGRDDRQISETAERERGRLAIAGGDLTGTRPTGNATWLGLMVGTPATGSNRGDRLMGDAALNYDMNAGGLDVAFSSIKNIDRGAAHSTPTVTFTDVPISTRGTFEAGFVGNRIQGGFYGPAHIEAAGIFEQSNIIGAFGARRYEE